MSSSASLPRAQVESVELLPTMLTHTLGHMRASDEVLRQDGLLALEEEIGIAGVWGRTLRRERLDPTDRLTSLTMAVLGYSAFQACDTLTAIEPDNWPRERLARQTCAAIVGNGRNGVTQMGRFRGVIGPVLRREQGIEPTTSQKAQVAENSVDTIAGVAHHNSRRANAWIRYSRIQPSDPSSPYDTAKFTLQENASGLAVVYARPEEARAHVLADVASQRRPDKLVPLAGRCPASDTRDEWGSLVDATWEFSAHLMPADETVTTLQRLYRDVRVTEAKLRHYIHSRNFLH